MKYKTVCLGIVLFFSFIFMNYASSSETTFHVNNPDRQVLQDKENQRLSVLVLLGEWFGDAYFPLRDEIEARDWSMKKVGVDVEYRGCYNKMRDVLLRSDILIPDMKDFSGYDCLIIPSGPQWRKFNQNPQVLEFIREVYDSGLLIASFCVGNLTVKAAGLVDSLSGSNLFPEKVTLIKERILLGPRGGGPPPGDGYESAPVKEICDAIVQHLKNNRLQDVDFPLRFDWRDRDILTPVKHQLNLGSCGVFAAVAVFESLIKKETGKTVDLSEQQIINDSRDFVPSGISSVDAMKYIKQYGFVLEERLPYEDKKTEKMPNGPPDYMLTDYHYVQTDKLALSEKIKTIKQSVLKYGPVATNMIFYQDLDRYQQGVYIYDGRSEEQGGHWVVIIGWQDDPKVKNGGYWICRNSWGDKWGENGYFNIAYGGCGIDDFWFVYGIFNPINSVHDR